MKIVLIACASKKKDAELPAWRLYDSPLFNYNFQYAHLLKPGKVFILSALYGLLLPERVIKPYNVTLNDKNSKERKAWAAGVLEQLKKESDLGVDKFIFLAGSNYRQHLEPELSNFETPLKGKGIGEQLQFLKRIVNAT